MQISVIITDFKKPQMLVRSLVSVRKDCPTAEIIVSDVAASPETEALVRKTDKRAIYLGHVDNIGFAHAVNIGFQRATGDYLFVLNSDIEVMRGTIQAMVSYLKQHTDVGLVGPKILDPSGGLATSPRRFYRFPMTVLARRTRFGNTRWGQQFTNEHIMQDLDRDEEHAVDWILGEAMMTTRAALKRVGHMDERFFLYLEDTDWCWSFWENGLQVFYLPQAVVREIESTGEINKAYKQGITSVNSKYTRIHIRSYWRFIRKHGFGHTPRVKVFSRTV